MKRIIGLLLAAMLLPLTALGQPTMPEDGVYSVGVTSSSKMFRVTDCRLQVSQGQMTALLTLSSGSYGYLYGGTAAQAEAAPRDSWLPPQDDTSECYTFQLPVPALDVPVDVAAWSKKNEQWYDRQLTFLSGSLHRVEDAAPAAAPALPADGRYAVDARSDSPLLKVADAILTVSDGQMQAQVIFEGRRYDFLYQGTAKDALHAPESDRIPLPRDANGYAMATLTVPALSEALPLATWSQGKRRWYDRTITFDAASVRPLGDKAEPSFAFSGGSGRTTIRLERFDAETGLATIAFSSSSYTQVRIGETVYRKEQSDGDAMFTLPLTVNGATDVSAETVAMSKPRWVDYTLYLYTDGTDAAQMAGQPPETEKPSDAPASMQRPDIPGLTYTGDLTMDYAVQAVVRLYEDGYRLLQTANGRDYLLVPEGMRVPDGVGERVIVLRQPLRHVYLVATSAMCLVDALGAMHALQFTGTRAQDWHIPAAREAMDAGLIAYAGKYSAPDYERLVSGGCDLTIQSTMVLQAPDVQEKFRELGIPMLIDVSGLEPHPLGRTEWVKVYGALLGREDAAQQVFLAQKAAVEALWQQPAHGPGVAYFYVNSNGAVVSKTAGDYIPALIGLAGGRYIGPDARTSDTASVTMDMESFYGIARDADYLIYNAAITNAPASVQELLAQNELFADFRAVKEGRVYAASGALYQSSHRFGEAARELNRLFLNPEDTAGDGFFTKLP